MKLSKIRLQIALQRYSVLKDVMLHRHVKLYDTDLYMLDILYTDYSLEIASSDNRFLSMYAKLHLRQ